MKVAQPRRMTLKAQIERDDPGSVCDFLAAETGVSKSKIKAAMRKGAVRIKRPGQSRKRIRRATAPSRSGDRIEFYYDEHILAVAPPLARRREGLSHDRAR
jgi:tRNA pseudouridine32 synthase/23S rRNA pseudouridine746 synthase